MTKRRTVDEVLRARRADVRAEMALVEYTARVSWDVDGVELTQEGGATAPVPLLAFYKQEQPLWCWAACMQMVRARLNLASKTQCEIANAKLARTTCCADGAGCNQACPFASVVALCTQNEFAAVELQRKLTEEELVLAADAAPVLIGIEWFPSGGHLVAALALLVEEGRNLVYLADPLEDAVRIVDYQHIPKAGRWTWTWKGAASHAVS